jgi:MutS domain V
MKFTRAPLEERVQIERQHSVSANERADRLESQAKSLGNLRGLTFVVFLFALGFAFSGEPNLRLAAWLAAFGAFGSFLWLISVHDRRLREEAAERRLEIVHAQRIQRLTGKSVELPDTGADLAQTGHDYAGDLDLFGRGSVFQHISTAHTDFGRKLLARWLLGPSEMSRAAERQAAVVELAGLGEFRSQLEQTSLGLLSRANAKTSGFRSTPNPEPLLRWIESPPSLLKKPLFRWGRRILPLATLAGMVLTFALGMPSAYWVIPLLLSLALLSQTSRICTEAFLAVSHSDGSFLPYASLLHNLETLDVKAPYLVTLKAELHRNGRGPSAAMQKFRNIVYWYEIRHNGMLYPFLDALLLWSLNCTFELERWKTEMGPSVRRWFEVIAEFEALNSLGELLANDADATMPSLSGPDSELSAEGLGHPMIPAGRRVKNDLPSLRPGQALLVTGSNMSGKSTFLRALGVNAVLGAAGGPVIATSMVLPSVTLGTSLRVSDSLLDQTSHFFAEVKKLAAVTKAATSGARVLFLLDEVLHGTNSRERQIGARWVLRELLDHSALGILTTHDEGLCKLEGELKVRVRLFHFRESVTDDRMTFDYRLRSGPVTSGNALRVMRAVGLEVPLEGIDVVAD